MQSKNVRIAGIILAILLGAAALFYLGGLVSHISATNSGRRTADSPAMPSWRLSFSRPWSAGAAP